MTKETRKGLPLRDSGTRAGRRNRESVVSLRRVGPPVSHCLLIASRRQYAGRVGDRNLRNTTDLRVSPPVSLVSPLLMQRIRRAGWRWMEMGLRNHPTRVRPFSQPPIFPLPCLSDRRQYQPRAEPARRLPIEPNGGRSPTRTVSPLHGYGFLGGRGFAALGADPDGKRL